MPALASHRIRCKDIERVSDPVLYCMNGLLTMIGSFNLLHSDWFIKIQLKQSSLLSNQTNQSTVEFRGSYRFLSGIKASGLWSNQKGQEKEKPYNEETHFLKAIFKLVNLMYENNFQSLAIFRVGPFSVNLCQLYSGDI